MRWSYKTVHYELKKEGLLGSAFLDEPEIELSLNQYGKAGWELVSLLETLDGLIAVFKQPLDLDVRPLSSPAKSPPEKSSLRSMGMDKEKKTFASALPRNHDVAIQDDAVAEAMVLDEFEIVEEKITKTAGKSRPQTADVGSIRIE